MYMPIKSTVRVIFLSQGNADPGIELC